VYRLHYLDVQGVVCPPPEIGRRWEAPDLDEGLRLVELVMDRDFANQITAVDVRNYNGRISSVEPHLRMYAQIGRGPATDIRWGRFPTPDGTDYVVSPQRKMQYLEGYAADHGGRLAGFNRYLDLRFGELHVSIN
jgi:TusA-related sulfurtransferase